MFYFVFSYNFWLLFVYPKHNTTPFVLLYIYFSKILVGKIYNKCCKYVQKKKHNNNNTLTKTNGISKHHPKNASSPKHTPTTHKRKYFHINKTKTNQLVLACVQITRLGIPEDPIYMKN